MSVGDIIEQRGIREVLHFTTHLGVTGILATGRLLCRNQLPQEQYLEHILKYNCSERPKDRNWHDYVNLSITTVNRSLFGISKNRWHADMEGWWCILSFSPEIMEHNGVIFTTTNNMYWNGVIRESGHIGLEKLFALNVINYPGRSVTRSQSCPTNQPTCPQAEVLYPNAIGVDFLQRVYVQSDENAAHLEAIMSGSFGRSGIVIDVKPELFVY